MVRYLLTDGTELTVEQLELLVAIETATINLRALCQRYRDITKLTQQAQG